MQSSLAKRITKSVNAKYGTSITIDKLGMKWNGDLNLKDVFIQDHHQDTLVYAKSLATSIISAKKMINENFDLGTINLNGGKFFITQYKGEQSDNISIFAKKFIPENPSSGKPFVLASPKIILANGHFRYKNENLNAPVPVDFKNISATVKDFNLEGTVINGHIAQLSFKAKRGYEIKSLEGNFHYDSERISLQEYTLETPHSFFKGNLLMDISGDKMSDFTNLVKIEAAFAKAEIATNDIAIFYNEFQEDLTLFLEGTLQGTLNDFKATNLWVKGLSNSTIEGDVTFKNLINYQEFAITGTYKELRTSYYDLKKLMPNIFSTLPQELTKLGAVRFTGANSITGNRLVTKGSFITPLGNADVAVTLSNYQDTKNAAYEGHVTLKQFDLGEFINDNRVGVTSMDLDIKGKGFIQESLDTQLAGTVASLAYNGYDYKNITVLGNLNTPKFNGEIRINDTHVKGSFNGLIDVSKDTNTYDFEADINHLDLSALGFVKDSVSILMGEVIIDMKGTGIEDATGTLRFTNTSYQTKVDTYFFKDFDVTSTFDNKRVRTIDINSSDIVSGSVEGVFKFEEVIPLFKNAIGSLYTNYQPEIVTQNQFMYFDFKINNKIVEVFIPDIQIEPETIIRGGVVPDDSEFKLTFKSPRIEAYGKKASAIEIRVDNQNPLFNTYIAADSIDTGVYDITDFNLINVTLKDTLFMKSEFKGGVANKDIYDLSLYHTINKEGKSVLGFKKSNILFKDTPWFINEENNANNSVVFDTNFRDLSIETIVLSQLDERIEVQGELQGSSYKDVKAAFTNVDLRKITPSIDNLELDGRVNGKFNLLQKNGAYYPNSKVTIDKLSVNDYLLGVLELDVEGNSLLTQFDIASSLKNENLDALEAKGSINANGDKATIDLDVTLKDFNVSPFDALGQDVISNLRGLVSGSAKITGDYKSPDINGTLQLNKGGMKIPYLNTDFDFTGTPNITLKQQQFIFNEVQIEDVKYKTQGILAGNISHKDFKKWQLDLGISADRLLVLDTENEVGSLYYGTAFISGAAFIKGPTDNLVIDVLAETEEGTVFNVPIDDSEALGDISYIHFLSPEEKEARINGELVSVEEIKGLSVNFDLDIDTDALIEVVVDQENGSVLKGRGAGLILIELDTNGKFKMNGDFAVYDGTFLFKYGGLVQKAFTVREDSNIRWDGIPTEAQLDISAVYSTEANPSILLENPSINRKIPVDVIINLKEELLQPEISFEIEFPNISSTVTSELEYRLSDRNTRELNAISLVSQGFFLSETSISAAAAVNNLLETTSSVLSNILFADDDSIFDVGIDLVQADNTPDAQSSGRVGFTLSTQITNRVLINGKVGVPTGGLSESIIVGDLEVDFLLNEDGTLRAKVFNRQSDIQFIGETEGYTQGAGISYAVDFSSFKELMRKIFSGKSEEALQSLSEKNKPAKLGPDGVSFQN